jgi:hypothetical protein
MKLKLTDGSAFEVPSGDKEATRFLTDVMLNRGQVPGEDAQVDWQDFANQFLVHDAVSAPDIRPLLSSTLEIVIREPAEPMMVITGLYNRVQARGLETKVLAGALGAVYAGDVTEHGTYPEVNFQVGGGTQVAYIGKSGIAANFTDEALRYSTWDIMAINLRLMGQALVRHKEQKAVSFLKELGTELYNNLTPATSMFGVLTGRALDMTANGTLSMDDLFRAMAHMAEEGFPPDVLLMNPLFFYMGIQDPVLRTMLLQHGGGAYFQQWTGTAGPLDPWSNGSMGSRGPTLGNKIVQGPGLTGQPETGRTATGVAGREHGMNSAPPVPSPYFPWNFRVVISPLVPFDAESGLGDIFLLSTGNVGWHLVDEDPTQVEWRDESVETVKVKIRERYGFAVAHEGQGVGVLKNVKLGRNYWDGTVAATTTVSGEIAPDTDLSGVL